jgi:lipopolysaccharide transport system ATP-binding protein
MDNNIAIEFQNVGKQYRLGRVGTGTLSHDLNRWWQTSILGKEDPYLKIGETNDRTTKGHSDYVWALQDISFKVERGDVIGIIGKNGAGKSTLLKLLSHITAPTTGDIYYRGRISSLLEVGTGFHPEMTGRENIYMNGSIMGMTRAEITRKMDEIVEFAGVERYLDTPVKRYSSGMTVRLGFAVAAFLEPEILVVDEVLTVGDAEFQKKAIGKMDSISREGGRTVLFVSHNMDSMLSLCHNGILLENGRIKYSGDINSTVATYLGGTNNETIFTQEDSKYDAYVSDVRFEGTSEEQQGIFSFEDPINISVTINKKEGRSVDKTAMACVCIMNLRRVKVCDIDLPIGDLDQVGRKTFKLKYPKHVLMPGKFLVVIEIHVPNIKYLDRQDTCKFTVFDSKEGFYNSDRTSNSLVFFKPDVSVFNG